MNKIAPSPRCMALRDRALVHEALKPVYRGGRKHQPIHLTADQAAQLPTLAAHLDSHAGWPPTVSRPHTTRLRHLNLMHAQYGPLALLTCPLDALDTYALHTPEVGNLSRAVVATTLEEISTAARPPVAAACHRGAFLGTHAHLVMPTALLARVHRQALDRARPGPGGGDFLLPDLHAVQINSTPGDLERVARYLTRHPNADLDHPGTDAYLSALDAELRRRAAKGPRPRLAWTWGVPKG